MGQSFIQLLECRRKVKKLEDENAKMAARLNPPSPPEVKEEISCAKIMGLLADIFPDAVGKIYVSDVTFEITAISELRRFVDWDDTNIFPYVTEFHDCDDFALALAGDFAKHPGWSGFPVSFIWGSYHGGHAFTVAIAWPSLEDRTPRVYFIEPQNDHEIAAESVEGTELWLLPMKRSKR